MRIGCTLAWPVHHETGGSAEGLKIFDEWSAKGAKYPGFAKIEAKWQSFSEGSGDPITVGTICKMLADAGYDWLEILAAAEPFSVIERDAEETPDASSKGAKQHPLLCYSLKGKLEELKREVTEQVPLLGSLILMGQYSIVYAAPNTGKTLLTLKLLTEAIQVGRINPSNVYYVNVDDNSHGLIEKVAVAQEFGFHMIATGFQGFEESALLAAVNELIDSDQAQGTVIILDTLKKFADLMNKTDSSSFNRVIRRFVMKGGTCVALAHVNKNRDASGKAVYAGTSDIIDDADCAYVLDLVSTDAKEQTRTVEFENRKRRGHVLNQAAYRYSIATGLTYSALLGSVVEVNDDVLEVVKHSETDRSNQVIVDAIINCITEGITTKMALVKEVAPRANVSQRTVMECPRPVCRS